jgi:hypothetical protein
MLVGSVFPAFKFPDRRLCKPDIAIQIMAIKDLMYVSQSVTRDRRNLGDAAVCERKTGYCGASEVVEG